MVHQKSEYRFVSAHHPPITAVTRRQGDNLHMTALVPMFAKYHVSAAFFGHDHNYQHYLKNGVHYVNTGGGGAPLYDVDTPPAGITQKVASVENFVAVSVNGEIAHVMAVASLPFLRLVTLGDSVRHSSRRAKAHLAPSESHPGGDIV